MRILSIPIKKLLAIALLASTFSLSAQDSVSVINESVINTPFQEYSPAFYPNGLIFIASNPAVKTEKKEDDNTGKATTSIFFANRNAQGTLDAAIPFAEELTTKYYDGPLSFNTDGNIVYFTRSNNKRGKPIKSKDGLVKLKIYIAEKKGGKWGNPVELPFNNSDYDCAHPSVSPDGRRLYFSSNRPGGFGGMDLYVSTLLNGKWSEPVNLGPKVNTEKNEIFPFIHSDGKVYFASNGHIGLGNLDILYTQKTDTGWLKPRVLPEPINSHSDDFGLIIGNDKKTGYFSSNRASGKGDDDIFSFRLLDIVDLLFPKVELEISPELLSGGSKEFSNDAIPVNDTPKESTPTEAIATTQSEAKPQDITPPQSEAPKTTTIIEEKPASTSINVAVIEKPINNSSTEFNEQSPQQDKTTAPIAQEKPSEKNNPTVTSSVKPEEFAYIETPKTNLQKATQPVVKTASDDFEEGFASEKSSEKIIQEAIVDEAKNKKIETKVDSKVKETPKKQVVAQTTNKVDNKAKKEKLKPAPVSEPVKEPITKVEKEIQPVLADVKIDAAKTEASQVIENKVKPSTHIEPAKEVITKVEKETQPVLADSKIDAAKTENNQVKTDVAANSEKAKVVEPSKNNIPKESKASKKNSKTTSQPDKAVVMNVPKPKKNIVKDTLKQEVKPIITVSNVNVSPLTPNSTDNKTEVANTEPKSEFGSDEDLAAKKLSPAEIKATTNTVVIEKADSISTTAASTKIEAAKIDSAIASVDTVSTQLENAIIPSDKVKNKFLVVVGTYSIIKNATLQKGLALNMGFKNTEIIQYQDNHLYGVCVKQFTNAKEAWTLARSINRNRDIEAWVKKL